MGSHPTVAHGIKAVIREGEKLRLPLLVEGQLFETIPDSGCGVNIVHSTLLAKVQGARARVVPQNRQG